MWARKTNATSLNLSNLISKAIPKSSGQKKGTTRRKGPPKGKKTPVTEERDAIRRHSTPSPPSIIPVTPTPSFQNQGLPTPSPLSCTPVTPNPSFQNQVFPTPSPSLVPPIYPPYYSSYYGHQTPPAYYSHDWAGAPALPSIDDQPVFRLKHLEGTRIRTCYGCGNAIRRDVSCLPSPPHDIVVAYKERRYYKDPTTHELRLTQNDENTYYHCMLRCISMKHPAFRGTLLNIPDDVRLHLRDIHHTHIQEQFGLLL